MEENKSVLDRLTQILLCVIGAAWFITQINFSFFNPINPMTIAPIFLCFGMAIVYLAKPFPGYPIHMDPLSLSVACHIGPGALAVAVTKALKA